MTPADALTFRDVSNTRPHIHADAPTHGRTLTHTRSYGVLTMTPIDVSRRFDVLTFRRWGRFKTFFWRRMEVLYLRFRGFPFNQSNTRARTHIHTHSAYTLTQAIRIYTHTQYAHTHTHSAYTLTQAIRIYTHAIRTRIYIYTYG